MKKVLCICSLILSLGCLPQLASAKEVRLKSGHPVHYTVQPGDTLWGIAGKFLDDPLQWEKLYTENPQISNPSKIYPGEILELRMVNGHPALYLHGGGTVKLRPMIRSTPIDHAIPMIPLDKIKPFLDGTRVVNQHQLEDSPYILAHQGEHVVTGAGDSIYVEGIKPSSHYTKFWIFRKGKPYVDPQTKENLGYSAQHIGQASIADFNKRGDPVTMLITEARREVLQGDRLMPRTAAVELTDFQPKIPRRLIKGEIIAVLGGVTQIGQFNVVVLDRGERNGLEVGDLLAISQLGDTVKNPQINSKQRTIKLPNVRAGELMVFRTFDKVSYGLILHATKPLHILDIVTNPQT